MIASVHGLVVDKLGKHVWRTVGQYNRKKLKIEISMQIVISADLPGKVMV